MSFQQGLSGLNTSAKALDVVGNNVSNSGTVGFKSARGEFADVFAASLAGAGGAGQVGIGSAIGNVAQQFSQGNLTTTNNPLDMAINGGGFFQMSNASGALSYTRNGQFHLDKDGRLINSEGLNVQGYAATFAVNSLGDINSSTPTNIVIDPTDLQPQTTFQGDIGLNLDSRGQVPTTGQENFDPANPLSYNASTSLTIYDSLGIVHTLSMYFIYAGQAVAGGLPDPVSGVSPDVSKWQVRYALDGVANPTDTAALVQSPNTTPDLSGASGPVPFPADPTGGDDVTLQFDSSGHLDSYVIGGVVTQPANKPTLTIDLDVVAAGQTVPQTNKATPQMLIGKEVDPVLGTIVSDGLDFSSSTQFGTPFGVNAMTQDGYPSGRMAGLSVSPEGIIQGRYTNGQTRNMAQIVLARFTNPNGLMSMGGNQWQQTFASGQPLVGAPGGGSNGLIQSSSIEESNVDLTKELVDMITFQRAYQANAQTVKTQDQVMQTLVNLR